MTPPSARKPANCWTTWLAESTGTPTTLQRLAAGLEYDGTAFFGWQHQSHARSIQTELDAAIARVADHPVAVVAAGRTDAGVHACGQIVHFDTGARRSLRSWLLGINSNLADDLAVQWVCPVPPDFHARYSAIGRTYRYVILNRPVRSALERHRAWCLRPPLDAGRMAAAAAVLMGEHDFSAFRGAGCQAKSPRRRIDHLDVMRRDDYVIVEVSANGFLYHMVRNLVGSLAVIGSGEKAPDWLAAVLAGRDRRAAAATAPPSGLYLAQVHYPAEFGLPEARSLPLWRDE